MIPDCTAFARRRSPDGRPRRRALAVTLVVMAAALLGHVEHAHAQGGKLRFLDNSHCYYVSPYFKRSVRGSVSLYRNGNRVQGPFKLGRFANHASYPGNPGLVAPSPLQPGNYVVRLTCDGTVHDIPIANFLELPIVNLQADNRSPRIRSFDLRYPIPPFIFEAPARQVPPGSTLEVDLVVKDPGSGGLEPDVRVKSIYGEITATGSEDLGNNERRFTYDWTIPDAPGIYDIFASVADIAGGYVEGSAKIHAKEGPALGALSVPAAPAKPSDKARQLDHFLTFFSTRNAYDSGGADTAKSACAYYLDLGFAAACNGNDMTTAIDFQQWKDGWGFDKPKHASKQVRAVYTNQVDLNLQRDMNAIHRGARGAAFYVCNYPVADPQLPDDPDLTRAIDGEALVACVAMEYSVTPGVNGGEKFTKFLVFDPTGRLTRFVNLDGRGEKLIPGACVVCHGATPGYSRYPETPGTGDPALGASFLPFDLDNYAFSTLPGFTRSAQQDELRKLNFFVRDRTDAPAATRDLVNGWYATATSNFDGDFVPPGWASETWLPGTGISNRDVYEYIVKPSCRTCHVAMAASFDSEAGFRPFASLISSYVCGNVGSAEERRYAMPNSLVTFDRFWDFRPDILANYLQVRLNDTSLRCDPPQ